MEKDEFSARRKKALSSCVFQFSHHHHHYHLLWPFGRLYCNKNCSKRFYLYTNERRRRYTQWQNPPQTTRLRTVTILLHYIHIFWNCFSLYFKSAKKRLIKKNLPFIHLPIHIPVEGVQHFVFYCRINAAAKKGSLLKRKSFPFLYINHTIEHTHTPSRWSLKKLRENLSFPSLDSVANSFFVIINPDSSSENIKRKKSSL